MFGLGLQEALEHTQDRKKEFPESKRKPGTKIFFGGYKQQGQQDR